MGTGRARSVATALSIVTRAWDIIKSAGFAAPIAAFASAAWVGAVKFFETVPWWIWSPLALVVAAGTLQIVVAAKRFWAIKGVKSFDLSAFAKQCNDYYTDWYAFAAGRVPAMSQLRADFGTREEIERHWQAERDARRRAESAILERFGPRALALSHLIGGLGIPLPHRIHFFNGDMAEISMYIGQVGKLLEVGLLDQAKTLDPHSVWGARLPT